MSGKYPLSGYSNDNLGSSAYSLLNTKGVSVLGVTSGRVLKVKSIAVTNEHASANAVVKVYDEAEAATPTTPTAANQRLTIIVGPADTCMVDFEEPVFFKTGCSATQSGGTVNAYDVAVVGWEE